MRAHLLAMSLVASGCTVAHGATGETHPFTGAPPAVADAAAAAPSYLIPVDLPAGVYRLDPRHATVTFRIRHMGLSWLTARFDAELGMLTLDADDPSRSRLSASVDASSVSTAVSARDDDRAFDRMVARALGAERTPQITFISTAIERTGENTAHIEGELTMNGQTHPATLEATFLGAAIDPLRGAQTVLGFSAHGVIDRRQWDVTDWSAFAGNEVQILIEAEFVRSGAG